MTGLFGGGGIGFVIVIIIVVILIAAVAAAVILSKIKQKSLPPSDVNKLSPKAKEVFDLLNQSFEQKSEVKTVMTDGTGIRVIAVPTPKGEKKTLLILGYEKYDASARKTRLVDTEDSPIRNINNEGESLPNDGIHNRLYEYAEYVAEQL